MDYSNKLAKGGLDQRCQRKNCGILEGCPCREKNKRKVGFKGNEIKVQFQEKMSGTVECFKGIVTL